MKSLRFLDRRAGYSLASLGLLLGMIAPAVFPAFASADNQVTARSISLSSSTAAASGVTYKVTFTPVTSGSPEYLTLLFCDDSPIVGQACNAPAGFSTAGATIGTGSTDGSAAIVGTPTGNHVVVSSAMTGSTPVTVVLDGLTNPTDPTSITTGFYGRIETFASSAAAAAASTDATVVTGVQDDGGIAMAITMGIGVTAAVRETMTFCVSGVEPGPDCGNGAGTDPTTPGLTLGEGTPKALDSGHLSTGQDWAQLSTNAGAGAVVNMKTDRSCGGLSRASAITTCNIAPAPNTGSDFTFGNAYFGVKLGSAASVPGATNPTGTLLPATGYDHYFMDYNSGSPTTLGVSGTYGSELFNSNSVPVSNKDIPLNFGASVSNDTPAGIYSANLSLIATGTF